MKLTARVPATSANLGPGFDCFGLALDLWNDVTVDTDAAPGVTWEGQGAGELPTDGTDMVSKAMAHAARVGGGIVPALALHGVNRIPLERGLGSSAAACVAGISIADGLLDLGLEPEEVLELAVEIEGHPDNAAAAIAGGFTLAFGDGVIRLDPHPDLQPVAFVPNDIRLPPARHARRCHRWCRSRMPSSTPDMPPPPWSRSRPNPRCSRRPWEIACTNRPVCRWSRA